MRVISQKGTAAPSAESVPKPCVNEDVVFEELFYCGASCATQSGTCRYSAQVLGLATPVGTECHRAD
jgi:hypothetical protein